MEPCWNCSWLYLSAAVFIWDLYKSEDYMVVKCSICDWWFCWLVGMSETEQTLKGTSQIKILTPEETEGMRIVCKVNPALYFIYHCIIVEFLIFFIGVSECKWLTSGIATWKLWHFGHLCNCSIALCKVQSALHFIPCYIYKEVNFMHWCLNRWTLSKTTLF